MLVKAKISLGNLLDNVMPGIADVLQDRDPHHKLTDFVLKYLHFDKIIAMGEKKFVSGYCSWAKNRDTACTNARQKRSSPWFKTVSLRFL
jgi:hypothetical protein